ncbi:MAG: TRL domain-containing protein [Bdellovibrionota bacterium]
MSKFRISFAITALAVFAASQSGCAFAQFKSPRSYRAATPAEVKANPSDPSTTGSTCMHQVLGLVAWGDAGYASAVEKALEGKNTASVLYNVKADTDLLNVLGVYSRVCTVVSGQVGKI